MADCLNTTNEYLWIGVETNAHIKPHKCGCCSLQCLFAFRIVACLITMSIFISSWIVYPTAYWFYWTHWGLGMSSFTFLLLIICHFITGRNDTKLNLSLLDKVTILIYQCALCNGVPITLLFWGLIYQNYYFFGVAEHGPSAVLLIIDFLISRTHVRGRHFAVTLIISVVYFIFFSYYTFSHTIEEQLYDLGGLDRTWYGLLFLITLAIGVLVLSSLVFVRISVWKRKRHMVDSKEEDQSELTSYAINSEDYQRID